MSQFYWLSKKRSQYNFAFQPLLRFNFIIKCCSSPIIISHPNLLDHQCRDRLLLPLYLPFISHSHFLLTPAFSVTPITHPTDLAVTHRKKSDQSASTQRKILARPIPNPVFNIRGRGQLKSTSPRELFLGPERHIKSGCNRANSKLEAYYGLSARFQPCAALYYSLSQLGRWPPRRIYAYTYAHIFPSLTHAQRPARIPTWPIQRVSARARISGRERARFKRHARN